jgi:hypothetical protein
VDGAGLADEDEKAAWKASSASCSSRKATAEVVDHRPVPPDEHLEGGLVAVGPESVEQLAVGHAAEADRIDDAVQVSDEVRSVSFAMSLVLGSSSTSIESGVRGVFLFSTWGKPPYSLSGMCGLPAVRHTHLARSGHRLRTRVNGSARSIDPSTRRGWPAPPQRRPGTVRGNAARSAGDASHRRSDRRLRSPLASQITGTRSRSRKSRINSRSVTISPAWADVFDQVCRSSRAGVRLQGAGVEDLLYAVGLHRRAQAKLQRPACWSAVTPR